MLDVLMSTGERRPVWGEPMGDQEMVQALAWRDLVLRGVPSLSGGWGSVQVQAMPPRRAGAGMAHLLEIRPPPLPPAELLEGEI